MPDTTWTPDLPDSGSPKYLALSRAIAAAIRAGTLAEGARLPPVRDLAWRLKVTPGTVARAYQIATSEGLLAATVGRGTFVAATAPTFGPTQTMYLDRDIALGRFDLRAPKVPDVGQGAAIAAAMAAMGTPGDWLDYPSQKGEAPLRAAVLDWLSDKVLGPVTPDDLALTHGGQNAITLILSCCLRGDRPAVLIEDLAYPGFRHAARLARAEIVGIETDGEGMVPEALDAACRRHPAQVLCLTPDAQNPTAAHMTLARRQEIVAVARAHDLQIVEDDCYATSLRDAPTIRSLAPERTWYTGGLSKTLSAALRFGWIVCPDGRGETGRLTAQHGFFALSRPVADLMLHLMSSGTADRLRRRVLAGLADRIAAMVAGLAGHDLSWQPGLPFLWLRLPAGWRASTFTRQAEAEGVLVRSADEYALVSGRAPNAVRLSPNGMLSLAETAEACARLARLLAAPQGELAV